MDDAVDLLVVGAGAIGLTAAWRTAQRGLSVRVIERDRAGAGASTAAAGILAPTDPEEWKGERGAYNVRAMAAWQAFARELEEATGSTVGFRRDGALRLAFDERDLAALDVAAAALAGAGVEHAMLGPRECLAEEPGVRGAIAGLLVPGDAQVDTDRLLAGLARACARTRVRLTEGVEPTALLRARDGTARGLRLSDGTTQRARLTVVAAGAWSSTLDWLPERARPPVRPLAGEFLVLRGEPVCRRVIRTSLGSVAPRDEGRLWVGTTVREAGYVALPRADAVQRILSHWTAVLPAIASLGVERTGVGLRPGTPDGRPIVGPSAIPGLAIATGHGREGIIQAPLAGEAVAELAAVAQAAAAPQ
jgi:glycine oxidase